MWWFLALVGMAAASNVTVVRRQLTLEEDHELTVDSSVEYILQFVPTLEQSQFPSRLWARAGAGDAGRPLLVTARQRAGATTWQLPYRSGAGELLFELQRTLCPDDAAAAEPGAGACDDEAEESRRGEFSLHVGSACAAPVPVSLRVDVVRDWRLTHAPTALTITQAAPRVHYYEFAADEDSVRLVVASEDDRCATVAVQPYRCPITQTLAEIEFSTLRMTVQRSGGAQLSKQRYPRGFYVISVMDEDEVCSGVQEPAADWLWEAAVGLAGEPAPRPAPQPAKNLELLMKASLTRAQYAVGFSVTMAVFLAFYVAFGVLVLGQRVPAWRRLVAPRAVLTGTGAGAGGLPELESAARRRRDSTATFDSSDNSDTDSDEGAADAPTEAAPGADAARPPPAAAGQLRKEADTRADFLDAEPPARAADPPASATNETADAAPNDGARPFGLPARLHVAALARRRARVLRARSDRYLYTLYTVAVFYSLPVMQFVAAFQTVLNVSGSLDLCYYNFLCAHPLGALSDFNHVASNLGYVLLGALFMLQLRRRRRRRAAAPRHEEYGIPQHYGLLSSLGAGMMVVALMSASYHVCPNRLNFQFDTAFMYVLAVLLLVKVYQARHPDVNARAHATFGVLAVLIALAVWGVLGGGALFWALLTVLHVFTFLLLSLRIYYVGQFRLEKQSLAETVRAVRWRGPGARPLYAPRLAALLVANAVNWAFAIYGLVQQANVASHLLFVLLCNALLYIVFYLSMKLLHGERPRWYAWAYLGGAAAAWAPALYFFQAGATDWAATPAQSRRGNHECRVLAFYDSHDLWHALSAAALYLTFNGVLTWDDGLGAVRRADIPVF